MKIKISTLFLFLALNTMLFAQQGKLTWYTNLTEASDLSIKTGKPVFAFFTGSDWCGWCMKLQANVFAKDAFVAWAQKNVILLELDFPRRKQLSPELTKQNNELQQTFQVQGFPTVWLFKPAKNDKTKQLQITPMGSLGYPPGATPGKEDQQFLATANGILGVK
ncbi:MAG: thioredoxin family protein [Bacteroidia bacterium]